MENGYQASDKENITLLLFRAETALCVSSMTCMPQNKAAYPVFEIYCFFHAVTGNVYYAALLSDARCVAIFSVMIQPTAKPLYLMFRVTVVCISSFFSPCGSLIKMYCSSIFSVLSVGSRTHMPMHLSSPSIISPMPTE